MVFLSIITPTFNSAKTIEKTLDSILHQEFKDYEYIIVDGGSTDSTIDIIKKYEPLFEGRLRWKSEPDKGIYDAFNKGCKQADGIYTWIVNSDDYISTDAFVQIHKKYVQLDVTNNNIPILIGGLDVFIDGGKFVGMEMMTIHKIEKAYKHNYMPNHPAMIIPKWIYEKYGYYDTSFKIYADMDFFHRIYADYTNFECIDSVITHMYRGGVSNNLIYEKEVQEINKFLRGKYKCLLQRLYYFILWHRTYFHRKRRNEREKDKTANIL